MDCNCNIQFLFVFLFARYLYQQLVQIRLTSLSNTPSSFIFALIVVIFTYLVTYLGVGGPSLRLVPLVFTRGSRGAGATITLPNPLPTSLRCTGTAGVPKIIRVFVE